MRGATRGDGTHQRDAGDFNPRTPCGVRRRKKNIFARLLFQSTHPMRGATGPRYLGKHRWSYFNPRTPCGVRRILKCSCGRFRIISIHAPHAGCDQTAIEAGLSDLVFQSTHPMRGATSTNDIEGVHSTHFNPRTPCGVRLAAYSGNPLFPLFQSTHPMRGATPARKELAPQNTHFNPRTPCGVRPH